MILLWYQAADSNENWCLAILKPRMSIDGIRPGLEARAHHRIIDHRNPVASNAARRRQIVRNTARDSYDTGGERGEAAIEERYHTKLQRSALTCLARQRIVLTDDDARRTTSDRF